MAIRKFVKPVTGQSRKEKSAVINFWRFKGKYTASYDDTSALLYDGKQVWAVFIFEIHIK